MMSFKGECLLAGTVLNQGEKRNAPRFHFADSKPNTGTSFSTQACQTCMVGEGWPPHVGPIDRGPDVVQSRGDWPDPMPPSV